MNDQNNSTKTDCKFSHKVQFSFPDVNCVTENVY